MTEEEMQCRICQLPSNHAIEDFKTALKARKELIKTPVSGGSSAQLQIGIRASDLQQLTIGFSLLPLNSGANFMIGFSGVDEQAKPSSGRAPVSEQDAKLATQDLKKRFKKIGNYRETDLNTLPEDAIHLAKTYQTLRNELGGWFPEQIFKHLSGNGSGEHAENKILETVAQLEQTKQLNRVNVYADRYTCPYCQELSFRANRVGGNILNRISEYQTAIRFVDMTHGPLQTGERLKKDQLEQSLIFIDSLNMSNKGDVCQRHD